MTLEEMVHDYLKRTGDTGIRESTYNHVCDEGFATWEIENNCIVVIQVYGNGKFWDGFFKDMGKKLKMNYRFQTARNPKAYERKFGAKVIGYIMEVDCG